MQKFGIWLLRGTLRLLSKLPLGVHSALGGALAWLACDMVRYRRHVVDRNLALCFPDKSDKERKAVRRGFYRHLGEVVAETVWFGGCRNPERLHRRRLVEADNIGEIAALFEATPSTIALCSHFGNWELYGGMASFNYTGTPMPFTEQNYCVVYLKQSSEAWNEILRENRMAPVLDPEHFDGYIESRDILRYVLRHRGDRKFYNVNTDQRPYTISQGVTEVDFLGQRTYTMTGAAALARKLGLAVVYVAMRRDRRGHYFLHYTPICRDASEMDVQQIMQQFYSLLEEDVRRQPEQYLWSHRRFDKPKNLQTQ